MLKTRSYQEVKNELDSLRRAFFKPGVIQESTHYLRGGDKSRYYVNFDNKVNNPDECRQVVNVLAKKIDEINMDRRIDYLAFIEKQPGNTVGAIRVAGALCIQLGIPNIVVRQPKELVPERIKISSIKDLPAMQKLLGYHLVVVTDHMTRGGEALRATDTIIALQGIVTDIVTYTLKLDAIKENLNEFFDRGVNLHSIHNVYDTEDGPMITGGSTFVAAEEQSYTRL